jgi:c-di-GMP-binding flagellar brake protein YcgR
MLDDSVTSPVGTASAEDSPEMSQDERRRQRRVEHFMFRQEGRGFVPVYVFSAEEEGCIDSLMVDLSVGGCAVLMKKDAGELPEELQIRILTPESDVLEQLELHAAPRWTDDAYSATHKQVGLQFTLLAAETIQRLEKLLGLFEKTTEGYFRCQLRVGPN